MKRLTLMSVQLLMGMAVVLTACNNGNHTDNMQGTDHSKMGHGSSGVTEQGVTQNLLTLNTKNVTRVNHDDPVKVAVTTSQTVWPATMDQNRPSTVILGLKGDWKVNLPSVTLIHHPNNGPLLYAEKDRIPADTMKEIQRLKPLGSPANDGVQVILIGDFATNVKQQLVEKGFKVDSIAGNEPAQMANKLDAYYAEASGGKLPEGVIVGSLDAPQYTLPAANWIAHMPESLLYVKKDSIPNPTVDALKKRAGKANIYILGPEQIISKAVEEQLKEYGKVTRISGANPEENAIAFAQYKDEDTGFGWGVTEPGHGFTFHRADHVDAAIPTAAFAHLGKHAPMLILDGEGVSNKLHKYLMRLQPTFKDDPTVGPYNHGYVIGTSKSISFVTQGMIDQMLEITSEGGGGHGGHH
ncbi:hypothetical protein EDC32_101250 [Laceyella sacchari]|uniref:cell wall-binding repeat-containing protein n=1 Tax=Laceyella sacchari TaxID=37482 RepID=UPI00104D0449|nr:cell wall-binding repeat-containing protein [Laceyella sacchari]TCW40604.1 hypothetical protein EDC32_101250 [Laceyella sacchari]